MLFIIVAHVCKTTNITFLLCIRINSHGIVSYIGLMAEVAKHLEWRKSDFEIHNLTVVKHLDTLRRVV